MRALAILIVPVLALALVRTAHAGACIGPEEADEGMAVIESYAKAKSAEKEQDYRWLCVELNAVALRPRIERACRAILDRDGLKSQCTTIAAAAGITQLGKHDLYAWVTEKFDDPVGYGIGIGITKTMMLGRMRDPRGLQVLLDAWKAAIPRAEALEKSHQRQSMMSWSVWRQHAAESIGALGGKDEIPVPRRAGEGDQRHVRREGVPRRERRDREAARAAGAEAAADRAATAVAGAAAAGAAPAGAAPAGAAAGSGASAEAVSHGPMPPRTRIASCR